MSRINILSMSPKSQADSNTTSSSSNGRRASVISFHVNSVVPKKPRKLSIFSKESIFNTHDSQLSNSFEKYGMFCSFEEQTTVNTRKCLEKGNYEYFHGGKARIVLDVGMMNKFRLKSRPSTPRRKKMIKQCPKLNILYHLSRDLNPQSHANKYRNKIQKAACGNIAVNN